MAQVRIDTVIDALSAQPVVTNDWLQRLQAASRLLFGGGGLAFLVGKDSETWSLTGFVDAGGEVVVRAPARLDDWNLTHFEVSMSASPAPCLSPLKVKGVPVLAGVSRGLQIPWPLGISRKFAFVALPTVDSDLTEVPAQEVWSFLIIANNLLRRTEQLASMDARAWIENEIRKLATLQDLLKPTDLDAIDGVEFAVHSRPHSYGGGDYYDIAVRSRTVLHAVPPGREASALSRSPTFRVTALRPLSKLR